MVGKGGGLSRTTSFEGGVWEHVVVVRTGMVVMVVTMVMTGKEELQERVRRSRARECHRCWDACGRGRQSYVRLGVSMFDPGGNHSLDASTTGRGGESNQVTYHEPARTCTNDGVLWYCSGHFLHSSKIP